MPVAVSTAPPLPELLSQPTPPRPDVFPQGQSITPPTSGSQNGTPGEPQPVGLDHCAMPLAGTPPAEANAPPTYRADFSPLPKTASARPWPFSPLPSAD